MRLFRFHTLGYSILLHIAIIATLFLSLSHDSRPLKQSPEITIRLHNRQSNQAANSNSILSHSGAAQGLNHKPPHSFDLRPDFAKRQNGIPFGSSQKNSETAAREQGNAEAQDLLRTDGKSLQAFDQLALIINGHLDYPEMLAENGVYGLATLDLYFDHDAKIDESRSSLSGDNRWIRGLFVKAARIGLTDWFRGMGATLKKDQFRDQHFRADFVITYTNTHTSELEKNGEGSYHLVRRRLVQTCLNPAMGGLDLTCAAMRVAGAISSKVSAGYKIKFQALKDRLEQFDETGLNGINLEVRSRSET